MPLQNSFAAGQDALLGFLAKREQQKMLEEDRARRDRLDQEASADRQRMREIQESQLASIETDRTERREFATNQAAEKQKAARAQFMAEVQNPELYEAYIHNPAALEEFGSQLERQGQELGIPQGQVRAAALAAATARQSVPKPEPTGSGFSLSPGQARFDASGNQIASLPDRPDTPAAPKVATPGQKLAAKQQAMRNAIAHEQAGLIPEGMTVQDYAQQLEDEYLSTLGFDVPMRPSKRMPQGRVITGHQGTPDPTRPGASSPGGNIQLGAAPPQADAPAPAASQEQVQALFKAQGVPPGKRVKLSDGSVWETLPDGQVRQVQ